LRVRFPAAATNTGMGKPPQCLTKPLRPTQPSTLSGMGNEYQPKCGDALRMDSKGKHGLFHLWINVWMAGTLYDPSLTCTMAERLRDEQLIIKRYTDKASFSFSCDECVCVSVCLSNRISPEPHARSVPLEFFCACCQCPSLGPPRHVYDRPNRLSPVPGRDFLPH